MHLRDVDRTLYAENLKRFCIYACACAPLSASLLAHPQLPAFSRPHNGHTERMVAGTICALVYTVHGFTVYYVYLYANAYARRARTC